MASTKKTKKAAVSVQRPAEFAPSGCIQCDGTGEICNNCGKYVSACLCEDGPCNAVCSACNGSKK